MKKRKNKDEIIFKICFVSFMFLGIAIVILFFLRGFISIIYEFVDIAKTFYEEPLVGVISTGSIILIMYITISWHKKDDFFYFVASILCSPSDYIYKRRKKQLLVYRNEIKELIDSINYFSNIDSKDYTKEDFWKFVDDVTKQNERLEENRKLIEKQNDRINIVIQIFILYCGIITSLFL